jgi:hypothetical protein
MITGIAADDNRLPVLKNVNFDFEHKEVVHENEDEDDEDGDDDLAVIYIDTYTDTYFICTRCEAIPENLQAKGRKKKIQCLH